MGGIKGIRGLAVSTGGGGVGVGGTSRSVGRIGGMSGVGRIREAL